MKKDTLFVVILLCAIGLQAQSYIGFLSDNYSGVNSVIANPANIVDSRFKTDINLVGFSTVLGNDYYGVNFSDALKDDYDFDLDANKSPSNSNNFGSYTDMLGPSFMFNLNEKSSIAVFTRARSIANINEINGNTIDEIDNDETGDFIINEGDFSAFAQAWAEVGLTYARVFKNDEQHFLKGGLSLKYLQGFGSGYVYGNNVTVDYDADGTDLGGGETTGSFDSTGEIIYGRFAEFDNDNYDYELPQASGLGVDVGVVYEWRPNYADYVEKNAKGETYTLKDKNKYILKLGLSLSDIGSINYKEAKEDIYDVNVTNVSEDDFDNAEDFEAFLDDISSAAIESTGYKANLPTALHINADWNFNGKLYLNLTTDLSLTKKGKRNTSSILNIASLTPRFESKWFSFYLPLSVIQYNGFQAGAGLRVGPLYVGSGSILSVLTSDNSKGADVYAGLKIPVYQGRVKDKDNDGVIDKLDRCPDVSGPVENDGCPWEDTDNDGVLDKDDECPNENGASENRGCPWDDADGDSVLDNVDDCQDVAGPVENKGCPWPDTDGDGVLDKDDECISLIGTVTNNGCPEPEPEPEVTEAVQDTLNEYAKTILFNSGKSTIKDESITVLNDIVSILQEYPKAKFAIEGHTDSVGSDVLNQKLSQERASSVMRFLIENGVASTRLTSQGYGESQPLGSNATKAGRAINRRVEINLIK